MTHPLTENDVVAEVIGNLLDDAAERMEDLVARIKPTELSSENGTTRYTCGCGESFEYLTLLELHRVEKHTDIDSIDQAVAILGMTAAEHRGNANLRLIVDGVDPAAFETIDAPERTYRLGRTSKSVVLTRDVSIEYVLNDEPVGESIRVAPKPYALSDAEQLRAADQHDLQVRFK